MKRLIAVFLLFLVVTPTIAFADNSSGSAMVSPTPVQSNNYTLPYPGILPDNPLYLLKVIRDQIITFFITDPFKKSEFFLLQSDKRIASSWYLLEKGSKEYDLAYTTLSKSNNYLNQAVQQARNAATSGESTSALVGDLKDAIVKHEMTITQMMTIPGVAKNTLANEEQRLVDEEKIVSGFSQK